MVCPREDRARKYGRWLLVRSRKSGQVVKSRLAGVFSTNLRFQNMFRVSCHLARRWFVRHFSGFRRTIRRRSRSPFRRSCGSHLAGRRQELETGAAPFPSVRRHLVGTETPPADNLKNARFGALSVCHPIRRSQEPAQGQRPIELPFLATFFASGNFWQLFRVFLLPLFCVVPLVRNA
jgi:hypothetical protein